MSKYDKFVIDYAGSIGDIQLAIDSVLTACKRKDKIIERLMKYVDAKDSLLCAYRIGSRPKEKVFDALTKYKASYNEAEAELNREEI